MKGHSSSNIAAVGIDACGDEGCARLVEAFGGMRIRIPKNVAGRLLEPLGADVLAALVANYAGADIDVPSRGHAERIRKSMRLKDDAIHSDLSANDLAARHGVMSGYVHKLRAQLLGKPPQKFKKAKA